MEIANISTRCFTRIFRDYAFMCSKFRLGEYTTEMPTITTYYLFYLNTAWSASQKSKLAKKRRCETIVANYRVTHIKIRHGWLRTLTRTAILYITSGNRRRGAGDRISTSQSLLSFCFHVHSFYINQQVAVSTFVL